MSYGLFEDNTHHDLRPFTFTRPVYALRCGILSASERWTRLLGEAPATLARDYLRLRYSPQPADTWMNGKFLPTAEFIRLARESEPNSYWVNSRGEVLLIRSDVSAHPFTDGLVSAEQLDELGLRAQKSELNPPALRQLPDIFTQNSEWTRFDFDLLVQDGPSSGVDDPYTQVYGADNLYIAPGVELKACILNAEDGPIYLGPGCKIEEGSLIRGTHGLHSGVTVHAGARLRGDSSFGPQVKIGGEVANSVVMGYSNKGHEGYLGNSVLGYWCNLGADTNVSNLKNNYANVKIWNYATGRFRDTGSQFCGLMMADHSKCGINTMFNTGTVVGVSANIFGAGYPRAFIPSFSWGGAHGFTTYHLSKVFEVAERVMSRRNVEFDQVEKQILEKVFELTLPFRSWEKGK